MIHLYIKKSELVLFILLLISIVTGAFYLGIQAGTYFTHMESESKNLLPPESKDKITIVFPNYSGFKNISSASNPPSNLLTIPADKKPEQRSEKNTFLIQVGAYKDIMNAKKDAKRLEEKGFRWQIKQGKLNILYVISEGSEETKEELKKRLKKEGFNI